MVMGLIPHLAVRFVVEFHLWQFENMAVAFASNLAPWLFECSNGMAGLEFVMAMSLRGLNTTPGLVLDLILGLVLVLVLALWRDGCRIVAAHLHLSLPLSYDFDALLVLVMICSLALLSKIVEVLGLPPSLVIAMAAYPLLVPAVVFGLALLLQFEVVLE
jgi:hypothetical protein